MNKRICIQFLVTAKEKRAIQRAAKRAGMSVSEWLRARAKPNAIEKIKRLARKIESQNRGARASFVPPTKPQMDADAVDWSIAEKLPR
jgi:hypothetical protein